MSRKRLTQVFPFLLPARVMQKKMFFYTGMRFDGQRYAKNFTDIPLPYTQFETRSALYNRNTGFNMVYQENKVFNLKLAAKTLNGLLIRPGETFSFWKTVRYADQYTPYRNGLMVENGKMVIAPGGGLCQMSNLLFWMFLHTPLTVVERSGHAVKEFPEPDSDQIKGVDATVSEGWLDLKVCNDTDVTYQIVIDFDEEEIIGTILAAEQPETFYVIANGGITYSRTNNRIYESVQVERIEMGSDTGKVLGKTPLYTNKCEIRYPLPDHFIPKEAATA